jgi:hypothetical protein
MIVMMDADGSSDPAEIPRFIAALEAGADFAKGTRFATGGGSADITRLRRAGNRVLSATVNVLFGTSYTDLCYGYNAFWRHCVPVIDVDCDGFEVETLITARISRAGLRVAEVPSFERPRIHGVSNLSAFRDGPRVLQTILRERFRRPPRHRARPDLELAAGREPTDAADATRRVRVKHGTLSGEAEVGLAVGAVWNRATRSRNSAIVRGSPEP